MRRPETDAFLFESGPRVRIILHNMHLLVTGATGFLGRRLLRLLLQQGHAISYLARKQPRDIDNRAAYLCWNADQEPPLSSAAPIDAVVHLAGEPIMQRWTPEVRRRIHDSRVLGTRRLVSAMSKLERKPAVLVSASAIGYYGDRGDEVLTENSPKGSGFLAGVCADWEQEAFQARTFGMRVAVVRIGIVLGTDGGALKPMLPVFRAGLGGKLGSGREWMSWIAAHDLIRLFAFAATKGAAEGVLNGTSPNPVTNADFTAALSRSLHRPAFLTVPPFALKIAYGAVGKHILDSARVLPKAAESLGFRFEEPELAGCLHRVLGNA